MMKKQKQLMEAPINEFCARGDKKGQIENCSLNHNSIPSDISNGSGPASQVDQFITITKKTNLFSTESSIPSISSNMPHTDALIEDLRKALSDTRAVSVETKELVSFAQSKYPQFPGGALNISLSRLFLIISTPFCTGSPHAVVVHASSTEDVVKVVKIANTHRVPVVPYAAGTSLEGNVCVHT